nr:transcriptional repressor LexA [Maliibacterium massiliense]
MAERMGAKQRAILAFIRAYIGAHGYPPSVREIGEAVDLKSTSTVHGHLTRLEKKGYLIRDPKKSRVIQIAPQADEQAGMLPHHDVEHIPVIGRVTAGLPILATENTEDVLPLPADFMHGDAAENFILHVQGDSMHNAGILDGDYVIVHKQATAENGDIVVAMLEEEATVKRFFREKDTIRLQPENDAYAPILSREITILGKVTGLLRQF